MKPKTSAYSPLSSSLLFVKPTMMIAISHTYTCVVPSRAQFWKNWVPELGFKLHAFVVVPRGPRCFRAGI